MDELKLTGVHSILQETPSLVWNISVQLQIGHNFNFPTMKCGGLDKLTDTVSSWNKISCKSDQQEICVTWVQKFMTSFLLMQAQIRICGQGSPNRTFMTRPNPTQFLARSFLEVWISKGQRVSLDGLDLPLTEYARPITVVRVVCNHHKFSPAEETRNIHQSLRLILVRWAHLQKTANFFKRDAMPLPESINGALMWNLRFQLEHLSSAKKSLCCHQVQNQLLWLNGSLETLHFYSFHKVHFDWKVKKKLKMSTLTKPTLSLWVIVSDFIVSFCAFDFCSFVARCLSIICCLQLFAKRLFTKDFHKGKTSPVSHQKKWVHVLGKFQETGTSEVQKPCLPTEEFRKQIEKTCLDEIVEVSQGEGQSGVRGVWGDLRYMKSGTQRVCVSTPRAGSRSDHCHDVPLQRRTHWNIKLAWNRHLLRVRLVPERNLRLSL